MQADMGKVCAADIADDRQAQPRPGHLLAAPIETLEHTLAIFMGNTRPLIFDFQYRRGGDSQNHIAPHR